MIYGTLGNFAAFFEIVVAVLIDGNRRRLRLLPFNMLGFLVSLFAISGAVWSLMLDRSAQARHGLGQDHPLP